MARHAAFAAALALALSVALANVDPFLTFDFENPPAPTLADLSNDDLGASSGSPDFDLDAPARIISGINGAACSRSGITPRVSSVPRSTATENILYVVYTAVCPAGSGIDQDIASQLAAATCLAIRKPSYYCVVAKVNRLNVAITLRTTYELASYRRGMTGMFIRCAFQRYMVVNANCGSLRQRTGIVSAKNTGSTASGFGCPIAGATPAAAASALTPTTSKGVVEIAVTVTTCGAKLSTASAADASRVQATVCALFAEKDVSKCRLSAIRGGSNAVVYVVQMLMDRSLEATARGRVKTYWVDSCSAQQHMADDKNVDCDSITPAVTWIPAVTIPPTTAAATTTTTTTTTTVPEGFGCPAPGEALASTSSSLSPSSTIGVFEAQITVETCGASIDTFTGADASWLAQALCSAAGISPLTSCRVTNLSGTRGGSSVRVTIQVHMTPAQGSSAPGRVDSYFNSCVFQQVVSRRSNVRCSSMSVSHSYAEPATPGCTGAPRVRKECLDMSAAEWSRYARAVLGLQQRSSRAGTANRYADFTRIHSNEASSGHGGAQFLPWHLAFLLEYESALREVDPSVSLCYWDWSVDAARPGNSPIWNLYGRTSGAAGNAQPIRSGEFANFRRHIPSPGFVGRMFTVGATGFPNGLGWSERNGNIDSGFWTTRGTLNAYISDTSMAFNRFAVIIESIHGVPHVDIGGDMQSTAIASNDPIFFTHHAFIDKIWWDWQRSGNNMFKYDGQHSNRAVSASTRLRGLSVQELFDVTCVSYQRSSRSSVRMAASSVRQGLSSPKDQRCADSSYAQKVEGTIAGAKKMYVYCLHGDDMSNKKSLFPKEVCDATYKEYLKRCTQASDLNVVEEDLKTGC